MVSEAAAGLPPVQEIPQSLIRSYRKRSNVGISFGLLGPVLGSAVILKDTPEEFVLGSVIVGISFLAWFYGLAFYAKAKGRSAGWAILGLFSVPGWIALTLLPDRYRRPGKGMPWTRKLIIGLAITMVAFYALATFMVSRTEPQPVDRPLASAPMTTMIAHG